MTINMLLKHLYIAIRYFYITNRLISKKISRVIHKPTRDMERDYLTKAFQGKAFHTHHKTLMGLSEINDS